MKYILIIWLSTGSITVPLEQGNCDSFMQELEDQGRITYNVPDTFLDSVPLWGYHCTTLEQLDAEFTVEELTKIIGEQYEKSITHLQSDYGFQY